MPSESDGSSGPNGEGAPPTDLLSSLRQRLEARGTVLAVGSTAKATAGQQQQQEQVSDEEDEHPADAGAQQLLLTPGRAVSDRQMQQQDGHQAGYESQQENQLLLMDLVSFDHCQELVQIPTAVEQQMFMQFDVGAWQLPLPSQARWQADQLQRLPQENIGLWVPPHPRINDSSLYKLEQRLAKGRTLDVRRLVRQLQEQFPQSQEPAAADAGALGPGGLWLDENGLMVYEPSPAKPNTERTWRRYDQDAASTETRWVPASAAPLHLLNSSNASYRLDVELGRLEFEVHPYMAVEQQLAAQLLCSFREYHRRASFGLSAYYGQKLAAFEDVLLNAREALFSAPADQEQQQQEEEQLKLLAAVAEAEREVAEVRQLREEEDALLLAAVHAMAGLWQQLPEVWRLQGGRQLTDLAFSVVQLPPAQGDEAPLQADGLTREQLDVALLVAEAEAINGLPPYPAALPVSQSDAELGSFKLRRVECMSSSHAVARAELLDRLQLLEGRVSADPHDPEILGLRSQLDALGQLPARKALSHQEEMELWTWAEQEVAAGRAGVYRPPRLRPCLSVLPVADVTAARSQTAGLSASISNGGSSNAHAAAGTAAGGLGCRLGQGMPQAGSLLQQQQPGQQQQLDAVRKGQVLGLESGQLLPVQQQGPKPQVKLCYYARLLVNGRVVGTSETLQLRDDFTLSFRDVFSIRLLKWPDSMHLELWEKGTFKDSLVAELYLAVPGLGGTPHVDPQAKPYSWTCPKPVPHSRLLQAVASLQPLGVLPAAQIAGPAGQQQQQLLLQRGTHGASSSSGAEGSRHTARAAAALHSGESPAPTDADTAAAFTSSSGGQGPAATGSGNGSSSSSAVGYAAMYPSGRLFVRCGWVADVGITPHFIPFQHTDGPFALGQAKETALLHSLRLPNSSSFGEDGTVQIQLATRTPGAGFSTAGINMRPGSAPGSPSKHQAGEYLGTAAYSNPLAYRGRGTSAGAAAGPSSSSPQGSPRKTGRLGTAAGGSAAPNVMYGNPLAYLGEDVEVGQTLAPPMPPLKADRALQRVAQGVGHKASAASKWLSKQRIDPNDLRNALLLELLRAREAAAHSGQAVSASGIFRLDLPSGLSLGVDRVADRRVAFIKQRWGAGPYRSSSSAAAGHASLQGARQLRVTAPLSAKDTLDLQDAHREALALIEAASMGVGGFMGALGTTTLATTAAGAGSGRGGASVAMAAASIVARQERALKWSQGVLARALETREASLRSFALRLRATASKLCGGRIAGRYKTDDVVKDTPLPEFKFDMSTLAAAFAPVRPLRPQRRTVKKVQATVPRETQLVITVQRASNLPRRIAAGGGGVRAQSPNRMTGARMNSDRLGARGTNWRRSAGTDSFNRSSTFAATGAGGRFTNRAAQESDDGQAGGFGPEGSDDPSTAFMARGGDDADGSSTCLSCFVEVHFRGKRQHTTAVDSNSPIWNEQVLFPVLGVGQEASPTGLRGSDNMVTINVFDEVVTPTAALKAMRAVARASNAGGEPLTEGGVLPERERRFLGCIRLSLAALYQAEVMDGVFKLDVPPVLFGYVAGNGRPPSLALYLTLKPRLVPPAEDLPDDSFTPGEQGDVTRHARKWVSGLSSRPACKGRVVKALAVTPEGVLTLLPRYLAATPLPPALAAAAGQALGQKQEGDAGSAAASAIPAAQPQAAPNVLGSSSSSNGRGTTNTTTRSSSRGSSSILQDSPASPLEQLTLAAARWVAHLPYIGHSWLGKQQQSRPWAVQADVVGMAAGGPEEHAHLLAGYFMRLGQQAFVVLGTSLSGAQAAFVLTTGQALPTGSASTGSSAQGGAASTAAAAAPPANAAAGAAEGSGTAAAAAAADASGDDGKDDVAAQHERLRQRLAAAAAAAAATAQARQRVSAAVAAAAQAGNPALEAAAAAEAAGVTQAPNVARLRLWNPMTGHCVPVRDPACELREVGTVYNSDNIWVNIQDSGHPWEVSWHLGDAAAWKPFFGPVLPLRELASIQAAPTYTDLEPRFYDELEASAEEAVRDALYEARSVVVTQPNNKLSRVLKGLLKELPGQMRAINAAGLVASLAMNDVVAAVAGPAAAEAARDQLQQRLQMIRALQMSHNDSVSREMRGCLINGHILAVPFSDNYADAVAEAVINSGVHRTVDPRVKFAMAAYVERMGSAFVACIWMYVAAIRETS